VTSPARPPGDPELRIDPLSGAPAVIVARRQDRPNRPAAGCPFCPGGLEAPDPYVTRWFPNRWPPLPDGRAEILLFAADHDASLGSLGPAAVARVLDLWADRTVAQGRRDDVAYVLLFENRGPEVGATIAHPHGQLFAFTDVPPAARAELAREGPCPLCAPPDGQLVVATGAWRAWVPLAAGWPYELCVAPVEHLPDLPGARATFPDAAIVIGDVLAALDRLWAAPMPYMLWIHQRPTDGRAWPGAHAHLHVAPLLRAPGVARFVAAGELGSGVFFNPVAPEDAATALRGASAQR